MMRALAVVAFAIIVSTPLLAQQTPPQTPPAELTEPPEATSPTDQIFPIEPPMTPERIAAMVLALDPEAEVALNGAAFTVVDVPVTMIIDGPTNRMRILVPIASADTLTEAELARLMQANFDTALDARYAIANGRLWSVYIHPLAELRRDQVIAGIAQTVTLAQTYGTSYASGGIVFGAGDSSDILLDELLRRGQEL